jgi:hypothetical protein
MTIPKFNAFAFAFVLAVGLVWTVTTSDAATYFVAPNGNDGAAGTSLATALLTIQGAANNAQAGDIVRVQAGTYNEKVSLTSSGISGQPITFVADGQAVLRQFFLNNVSYVNIIGFEITQTSYVSSGPYTRGIIVGGACDHIGIIDNNIHDIQADGIWAAGSSVPTYITIRGNTIDYMGHIPGIYSNSFVSAISGTFVTPHHWVIEYNAISRSGDFIDVYGTNFVLRNNYMHNFNERYWTNAPNAQHSDMFQCGSDQIVAGTRFHVIERNFCGDSTNLNSHFGIWQDTMQAGDTNITIRGNVGYNFGSTGIGVISAGHVVSYNNTFYKMQQAAGGTVLQWYKKSYSSNYPTLCMAANTIIDDYGLGNGDTIYVQTVGNNPVIQNNLGYLAGTDPSFVSTSNPMFVDPVNHDFHLQAISPANNAGANVVWVTSSNGSGTSFGVNDAQLLCDGFGMVDGDTITLANGQTTWVTNITANILNVSTSVTWTKNMAVYWGKYSRADIGALPFGSKTLSTARLYQTGNDYSVGTTGDARGVWYYVDGIPTTWVSTPPFTATITSGIVTAKAYALYAQPNPVVVAIITHGTLPTPPSGLTATNTP